jgi:glyoxylase-like metal-dependent hydrolase (beta-lactamase superfamily II)
MSTPILCAGVGFREQSMSKISERNPDSAPGDWFIDQRCIDCAASRTVAPGLIVRRNGKSVFARQPENEGERLAAWRAALVCPTASVGTESHRPQPSAVFPHELAPSIYRCGYNARSSWGAHSYLVKRPQGNLLVDAPRFVNQLVAQLEALGGIQDILLTHRDDVAEADRYAHRFGARVWIHEDDQSAAPYATHLLQGVEATVIRDGLLAIPVPGHTKGSVAFLLEDTYLFSGDSLAWSVERRDLAAFHDACWYSWAEQGKSLERLASYRFEWILAGHGAEVCLLPDEMRRRLLVLVERMRR